MNIETVLQVCERLLVAMVYLDPRLIAAYQITMLEVAADCADDPRLASARLASAGAVA